MSAVRDEVKRHFGIEAAELVQSLSVGLLALARGEAHPKAVASLFRSAHTLKGGARLVGKTKTAEAAHMIEDALAVHRDQGTLPGPAEISDFLRLVDAISGDLGEENGARVATSDQETTRVDLETIDAFTEALFEAEIRMGGLRTATSALEHAARLADRIRGQLEGGASPQAIAAAVEELASVVTGTARDAQGALDSTVRGFAEARAHADDMRLLPARSIFSTLERAARDAALELGRKVAFHASGGDTRLDGHVLHAVKDALIHLVRNAVAHGIETPELRLASGKSETGEIRLQVERQGGRVVFRCSDDGQGVDVDAVKARALEKGLASPDELAWFSESEALNLVWDAGLSTAAEVSEWSGRGVGMDVARNVAARCKGEASLESRPGRGTTVSLAVSVSMSTLNVLAVLARDHEVMLPLEAVHCTVRATAADLVRGRDARSLAIDGEAVPFYELSQALGDPTPTLAVDKWSVVVLRHDGRKVAIGTDALAGTSEIALRRLPKEAGTSTLVAGATFDANGDPILVLDAEGLVAHASRAKVQAAAPKRRSPPVLVIDDSLTTRMLEQSILEGAGYRVELASSAEEALQKAAARAYSLFVVDAEMPGMSGFEFVATTRQHATLKQTPVMMVTSLGSPEHRARGMDAGAAAYIVKGSFDQHLFLRKVSELAGPP